MNCVIIPVLIDLLNNLLIKPLYSLSLLPQTILELVLSVIIVNSHSMLSTLIPLPFISSAVSPIIDSESTLLIVLVEPFISVLGCIKVDSQSDHLVVHEIAVILPSIGPQVSPQSSDPGVFPLASVHGPI